MQAIVPGRVVKETNKLLVQEARLASNNQRVSLIELRATDAQSLRKILTEVDLQRSLDLKFTPKIIEADVTVSTGSAWTVRLIREHCNANLKGEIKRRKERSRQWSDNELLQIASNLIEALTELQLKGAAFGKVSLKSLLVRKDGDIVLGSYNGSVYTTDSSKALENIPRLAVVLARMTALDCGGNSDQVPSRYIATVDFSRYPKVQSLVSRMTAPRCDFVTLREFLSAPTVALQSRASLTLPAIQPVVQVAPRELQKCAACNGAFSSANFQPSDLRPEHQHYRSYLDRVCSIACLDVYIKYVSTEASKPLDQCMICGARFYLSLSDWRATEASDLKRVVCSAHCLQQAMQMIR